MHYHEFSNWGNDDNEAASVLSQYDIVVAGGGLYSSNITQDAAKRQINIIQKAKKMNQNLKVFFYISIASWRRDGDWSHILGKGGYWDSVEASKHPNAVRIHTKWEIFQMLEYATHAGGTPSGERQFIESYTWQDDNGVSHTEEKYIDLYTGGMAFDGCFYDDAGMESDEGRINQGFPAALREKYIQLVNFTHERGLAAFPNQLSEDWYSDQVSNVNPKGLPSSIDNRDYMLLESCHSQVGFQGKPLWRHVNGTESVWNYYQNWYSKVGAKVVVNDYLYGTGGGSKLSDEEFYELATYLLCDSLCCGAHYIDLNGLLSYDYPDIFKKLLIPKDEGYNIQRTAKGHYILHANGHTLEVVRGDNLTQGETVNLKTLDKIYIYFDGIRIKNAFSELPAYSTETNKRLDILEQDVTTIKTSHKSTANIYHRMMIDDWGKKLIFTNYVSTTNFVKKVETTAKTGIATVEAVDYKINRIRLTRLKNTQINEYVEIDITEKKGHTFEIGFQIKEVSDGFAWGFNAYQPAKIDWTYMNISLNTTQKSSYYGEGFYGCIRRIVIPEDTEEETWKMRICYNGSVGQTFDLSNFYIIDLDEYGEDITKEWYTNCLPSVKSAGNYNGIKVCYTLNIIDDYGFDITWNIPAYFANWSGLIWNIPDGTFQAGHTYELGCETYEDNTGGTGIAFRVHMPGLTERWWPKTYTMKSSIYGDTRPGLLLKVPESATTSSGNITFTNTSSNYKNSSGDYYKSTIRGLYIYDVDEENIVFRGKDPSNSYLRICRVTDEKLEKDKELIGNALYITDSGKMFITDFNGNRTDIVK